MEAEIIGSLFFILIILLALLKKIQWLEFILRAYIVLLVIWGITLLIPPLQNNWVFPIFNFLMRASLSLVIELVRLLGID